MASVRTQMRAAIKNAIANFESTNSWSKFEVEVEVEVNLDPQTDLAEKFDETQSLVKMHSS
jgi:predicted component of type VI protein secretion system